MPKIEELRKLRGILPYGWPEILAVLKAAKNNYLELKSMCYCDVNYECHRCSQEHIKQLYKAIEELERV